MFILSNASTKFSTNSLNVVSVECFCLNLCYLAKNILLVSMFSLPAYLQFFSRILDRTGNKEMGLWLSLTDSPPLCSRITLAILHMSGKVVVIKDLLYIIVSGILMV